MSLSFFTTWHIKYFYKVTLDFTAFTNNGVTVGTIESCLEDVVQRTAGSWDHYFPGTVWTAVSCVSIFLGHARLGVDESGVADDESREGSRQELSRILATYGTPRQMTEPEYMTRVIR